MIQQFLNTKQLRVLSFLELLYEHPHGLPISFLSRDLDVSVQTIYLDIEYLEREFSENLKIMRIGNTVQLEDYSIGSLMEIKEIYLSQSHHINLFHYLINHSHVTVDEVIDSLDISKSTLIKVIKSFNRSVEHWQFSIQNSKSTLSLNISNKEYFVFFACNLFRDLNLSFPRLVNETQLSRINQLVINTYGSLPTASYMKNIYIMYAFMFSEMDSLHQKLTTKINNKKTNEAIDNLVVNLMVKLDVKLNPFVTEVVRTTIRHLVLLNGLNPGQLSLFFNRFRMYSYSLRNEVDISIKAINDVLEEDSIFFEHDLKNILDGCVFHLHRYTQEVKYSKKHCIGIWSDLGSSHCNYLVNQMSNYTNTLTYVNLNEEPDSTFDILLSTVVNAPFKSKRKILINDSINIKEVGVIFGTICKLI